MELPIWYKKIITGHIDLVGIKNGKIIIIEYKPKEADVYKRITQVCIYAYMISKTLKIDIDKIKCIIYSPNLALSFTSNITEDIIKFVHTINSKRQSKLKLKEKTNDFEIELHRILNS